MNPIDEISKLLQTHNLWNFNYTITPNPNLRGQSISYFILNEIGTPIYIAKFFDYFKGVTIPNSIDVSACKTPDELIDKLSDTDEFMEDIEQLSQSVYYKMRSFQRYIQVSQIENSVFPKILAYKNNLIACSHFYGLLIEVAIHGITLETSLKTLAPQVARSELAIDFLQKMSDIVAKFIKHDIVHRDLSPDNIMVNNGNYIVIDPGMVKILSRNTTQVGFIMGKKNYASPEQYYGLAVTADFTSDLYSIGLITFEIVTGINPLAHYIKCGEPHPHETIIKKFDRELEDVFFSKIEDSEQNQKLYNIIRKLLQTNKTHRFDSILTLQEAIHIIKEDTSL